MFESFNNVTIKKKNLTRTIFRAAEHQLCVELWSNMASFSKTAPGEVCAVFPAAFMCAEYAQSATFSCEYAGYVVCSNICAFFYAV